MARGRTLFSEHRVRAASVPVGDLRYPNSTITSKLHGIRSHVSQDRDFLHRAQSTLARPPTFTKAPPTLNHNRAYGPPPSRSAYYIAAPSSAHREQRRRTMYEPTSNRVSDYEVDAYLATPTRPPFVSRALRSGSVPPVLPSTITGTRWVPSSHARGSSVPRWTPSTYRTYGTGKSYYPDFEDSLVGAVPATRYGDVVIGTPYRKPFVFDDQHEDVDIIPHHYTGSGYGTRSTASWYPSYTLGPPPASSSPGRFSTTGYPTRVSSARYTPTSTEVPKDSFSKLHHWTPSAEPLHSRGAAATKVSPLGTHSLPTPSPSTGASLPRYTKPPISDTRQRVRDLLCKTKKDPHYFDD